MERHSAVSQADVQSLSLVLVSDNRDVQCHMLLMHDSRPWTYRNDDAVMSSLFRWRRKRSPKSVVLYRYTSDHRA